MESIYRRGLHFNSVILVLRVTVRLVLQAHEEADLLGGRGGGDTGLLVVGGAGGGGLGLGDLPVAAVEIQRGESGRVAHLADGSTLHTLQVQRRRTQALSQTEVTESGTKGGTCFRNKTVLIPIQLFVFTTIYTNIPVFPNFSPKCI